MQDEIETVDVESCNDDVPDSGSELSAAPGAGGTLNPNLPPSSMHNSNTQPGKLDGILYRTACVINQKDSMNDEQDVSTNVAAASSSSNVSWSGETTSSSQAHISGKLGDVSKGCTLRKIWQCTLFIHLSVLSVNFLN